MEIWCEWNLFTKIILMFYCKVFSYFILIDTNIDTYYTMDLDYRKTQNKSDIFIKALASLGFRIILFLSHQESRALIIEACSITPVHLSDCLSRTTEMSTNESSVLCHVTFHWPIREQHGTRTLRHTCEDQMICHGKYWFEVTSLQNNITTDLTHMCKRK